MRYAILWSGILALAFMAVAPERSEQRSTDRPPNLILIMADDLGAREIGAYGHSRHRTPNLDQLARTGVQFSTCYATPVCHPTRFEIMTGQYGHHNGVYQFSHKPGGPKRGSKVNEIANHLTFAQVLKQRGYATAHAGKWQLSGRLPKMIREVGFDEYSMYAYEWNLPKGVKHKGGWEGDSNKPNTSRHWHPSIIRNGEYLPTGPDDYGPDIFTDFVIDFARRHKDEPFFIYYPMCLTHVPYYPTPDTIKSNPGKFTHSTDNHQGNVEYMDKLVGRIIRALGEMGLRDNSIVFFTADNGTIGGGKGRPTELGARVPMIVNGPGYVKPIHVSRDLIDLSDILPTLVDLAGAKLPGDHIVDGRSFASSLRDEPGPRREWIYSYLGGHRIVRTDRWLLEANSVREFGRLYDCGDTRDGSGCTEVTGSKAPHVLAAREMMEKILTDKPVPEIPVETPDALRRRSGPSRSVPDVPPR